ncbi:MAG TPA: OmpA family protein [Kofleriaceae bacterium]|nr:OmpA family protein [Kofleriaceae bacterium]
MRTLRSLPFILGAALALTGCASDRKAASATSTPGPDFANRRAAATEPAPLAASDGERPISPDDQLFFAFDSDRVDRDGQIMLAEVAAWVRADASREIVVQGHADPSGNPDYNLALSSRRARAVAAELERQGVPRDRVVILAVGESNATLEPGMVNRRVVIFASAAGRQVSQSSR